MKILQRAVREALGQYTTPSSVVAVTPGRTIPVLRDLEAGAPADGGTVAPNWATTNPTGFTANWATRSGGGSSPCPPGYSPILKGQPLPTPSFGCQNVTFPAGDGQTVCGKQVCPPGGGGGGGLRDIITTFPIPPYTSLLPPGSGGTVVVQQPGPCCPPSGSCRQIPWQWWQGNNGINGRGVFQRQSPI